jgi:sirohydrochlorin ferrochelatase
MRWPWLQRVRRLPRLDVEPWLVAIESGVLWPDEDLVAVLAQRLDPAAQVRLLRWWRLQPDADPTLPARVLSQRDPASAAWLAEQLAPGPPGLGSKLPEAVAASLLPLLGHQRQERAWPLLTAWLLAPIPLSLRRAALEGVALGYPSWPRAALARTLSVLAADLDPQLAATAVDLLARLPAARGRLLPLRRRPLDEAVAWRVERRLASMPARPLLLVVHGRSGGELPAELGQLAAELERRRGAPVRIQSLTAAAPPDEGDFLRPERSLSLVPLLLLPGGHVRHDLPAIVCYWRGLARVGQRPFLGAWPCWQRALRQELARLGPDPLLLHHPLEGALAARFLAHLERVCAARCLATPYSADRLAELKLTLSAPALPLALAANRLTEQLNDQVGPPLLQRPALRELLLSELEAMP